MKIKFARFLSICLLLTIILTAVPALYLPSAASASTIAFIKNAKGSDFSNNTYIGEKLDQLFALLPYSEYPYFTDYGNRSCGNSMCTHCSLKSTSMNHPNLKSVGIIDTYTSYSCFAFARYAFYYIWGVAGDGLNYYGNQKGNNMQVYNRIGALSGMPSVVQGSYGSYTGIKDLKAFFMQAHAGDIIQGMSKYDSAAKKYNNHSMIFLSCDEEGIYVLHSNAFRSSIDSTTGDPYGYNRVMVSYITYERFMENWDLLVTDFRARQDIFEAVLAKGENACGKHVYNADNMDRCIKCFARYTPVLDPSAAGLYVTSTIAGDFVSPYLQADVKRNSPNGAIVEVTASLYNSLGQLWYLRPDGTYCYGGSLKKVADDASIKISLDSAPKGELLIGRLFDISGSVSTEEKIVSIVGMLLQGDGKMLMRAEVTPNAKRFELLHSDINGKLKFGTLQAGDHRFLLAVRTESGKCRVYQSDFTMVKTEKKKPQAPAAPTLASKSAYSVTLEAVDGYEYSVGGGVWKTSAHFEGLLPMTEYTFYCRLSETATEYASDRSAPLVVTTPPAPAPKPSAPTVVAYTDTTVTLAYYDGLEYSYDKVNWQSSPLFTDLNPKSTYLFVCRVAASANLGASEPSDATSVTTEKRSLNARPSAPVAVERTANSITLASADGYEYRMNGGKWQASPVFTGLSMNREYKFTCRIAETDDTAPSAESEAAIIRTRKNPNNDTATPPVAKTVTANSILLDAKAGHEYSMDGRTWKASGEFAGLKPNTAYSFYSRIAESETKEAGKASEEVVIWTKKTEGKTADAPKVASYTVTSVTLVEIPGAEYRVDGGKWQESPYFPALTTGKHVFTARYAETSTAYAGKESAKTVMFTLTQTLTSEFMEIDEQTKLIRDIDPDTGLNTVIDNLDNSVGLSIYRKDKKLTDLAAKVATGDVLKIEDENGKIYCQYTVVVKGDVSGDGRMNITDMLQVKACITGQLTPNDLQILAGDLSGDGRISILDFLQIKAGILGA